MVVSFQSEDRAEGSENAKKKKKKKKKEQANYYIAQRSLSYALCRRIES